MMSKKTGSTRKIAKGKRRPKKEIGKVSVILASGSPRRIEILKDINLRFDAVTTEVDETPLKGEKANEFVKRIALLKASQVADRRPGDLVIAADTAVAIGGRLIGKPDGKEEAERMLSLMSGKTHKVVTGLAFILKNEGFKKTAVSNTNVVLKKLTKKEIDDYLLTGEYKDKAGAYAIQGHGKRLIESFSGSYSNVVGLPITELLTLILSFGFERIPWHKPVLVIGLTGGIGSGKSTVLKVFKKLGAQAIDADQIARDVVKPGKPAWLDIRKRFGPAVFHKNHRLNRKKLASIVFGDKKALKDLNAIVHPRVFEQEKNFIKEYGKKRKKTIVLVDASLMIETGSHTWKDVIVLMDTSRENQVARLLKEGKWGRAEIEKRIDSQMPFAEKFKYADYVIDNNATLADCRRQAEMVYREIVDKHLK